VPVGFGSRLHSCCWDRLSSSFTVFGRYIHAIGSNPAAAVRSGIGHCAAWHGFAFADINPGIAAVFSRRGSMQLQPVSETLTLTNQSLPSLLGGIPRQLNGSSGMIHVLYGCIISRHRFIDDGGRLVDTTRFSVGIVIIPRGDARPRQATSTVASRRASWRPGLHLSAMRPRAPAPGL